MELMLRFCDSRVVASAVLSGELRDIVSAFLPAPVAVQASRPGDPEELPQLAAGRYADGGVAIGGGALAPDQMRHRKHGQPRHRLMLRRARHQRCDRG